MALTYYIPGAGTESEFRARAKELKLLDPLCRSTPVRSATRTPEGQGLFSAIEPRGKWGWLEGEQEWHRMADGAWWLGVPQTYEPASLARDPQISGHFVKLGDGRSWLVPCARVHEERDGAPRVMSNVPLLMELDASGEWTVSIEERFRWFSDRAGTVAEMLAGTAPEEEWTWKDDVALSVEALGLNYFLGKWEVSALRLLTTETVSELLRAVVDVPGMVRMAEALGKKKGTGD